MRIGAISDVHSDARSLEDALSDMGDVDLLVCAGDFVGYGREPNEVVERLQGLVSHAVKGNHDAAVVSDGFEREYWRNWMNPRAWKLAEQNAQELKDENATYLKNLPLRDVFDIAGRSVLLVHGSPDYPLEDYVWSNHVSEQMIDRWFPEGERPDVIIHGQTHEPYAKRIGETLIVNPGSVSLPRTTNASSYAILDFDECVKPSIEYLRTFAAV